MSFQELGLLEPVVHGVQSLGFVDPTPVQEKCVPLILQGKDVIGSAQTGTGKTAAFALPILTRLGKRGRPRCLVLEPTRELAIQVETAFQSPSLRDRAIPSRVVAHMVPSRSSQTDSMD